ncbi:MAG: hypothetical protein IPN79_10520 [Saprospiraceae bacterium]|nr:hypothetical protein [Saprospiraceae bacterium]
MPEFRIFAVVFVMFFTASSLTGQYKGSYKVTNKLHEALTLRSEARYDVHVMFDDQVDLNYWEKYFETNHTPFEERAKF